MALKTVDLTNQSCRALFTGCSQEEVSYAKTFWQSIQLLPPMESRLVSSDIKQRLRKAPPSRSLSECESVIGSSNSEQFSCSFTMSTSSCCLEDSLTKRCRLYTQPQIIPTARHDSLQTQTSLNPLFDSMCQSTNHEPKLIPEAKPDNKGEHLLEENQKQLHRKTSFSYSGKDKGASSTGGGTKVLGAGGREFWSLEGNKLKTSAQVEIDDGIIPFSGDDLCHRKGFRNWGQQKVVSMQADSNAGNANKSSPKPKIMLVETARTGRKNKFTPPHRNRKLQTVVGTQKLPGEDNAGVASLFKTILISPNDTEQQSSGAENNPKLFRPKTEKSTMEEISIGKIPVSKQSSKKEEKSKIRLIAGKQYYKSQPSSVKAPASSAKAPTSSAKAPQSSPKAFQSGPKAPEGETKVTPGIRCVTVSDYEAVGFPKVADEPLVLTLPGTDIIHWSSAF